MYADDLALVASSPEELQAMLDIVTTYADKWQYQLNADKSSVIVLGETEGSATACLGVRDFEIHWISRGFWISDWNSGFHVDFWISKWISGFQSGFLDFTWISGFQSGFLDFTWISGFQSGFLHSGFCLKSYYLLF